HGAVAREIGLAGEHVHHLRAGDARQQLHREGDDAGIGHGLERRVLAVGIHHGDDERALLVVGELGGSRPTHLEHDVGILRGGFDHGRAGGGEFCVGNPGFRSSGRLDGDIGAERFHLLDCFRRRSDPVFRRIDLARYGNAHSPASSWPAMPSPLQPPEASASAISEMTTMTTLGSRAPVRKPWTATMVATTKTANASSQCPATPPIANPSTILATWAPPTTIQ